MKYLFASGDSEWLQTITSGFSDEEVFSTTNGFEAVDHYFQYLPNVVFIDLNLKIGSGIESIERICKNSDQSQVIAVSDIEDPIIENKLKNLGVNQILVDYPSPEEMKQLLVTFE